MALHRMALVVIAIVLASARGAHASPEEKAKVYLNSLKVVRLNIFWHAGLPPKVEGVGHLDASRTTVENLALLGFEGTVEAVYQRLDAGAAPLLQASNEITRDMLRRFYPTFPDPETITGPSGNKVVVTFMSAQEAQTAGPRMVQIGPNLDAEAKAYKQDLERGSLAYGQGNARIMVKLTTLAWPHGGPPYLFDHHTRQFSVVTGLSTLSSLRSLEGGATAAILALAGTDVHAAETVKTILDDAGTSFDLLPAYGVNSASNGRRIVRRLLTAAKPASTGKPLLLVLLGGPDSMITSLVPRYATWAQKASDGGAAARVKGLQPGQIGVVVFGPLDRAIFRAVLQKATRPYVLEGAGSAGYAGYRGLPYVSVADNSSVFNVKGADSGQLRLRELGAWLDQKDKTNDGTMLPELSSAMIDAFKPSSDLGIYYAMLKAELEASAAHQLAIALAQLADTAPTDGVTPAGVKIGDVIDCPTSLFSYAIDEDLGATSTPSLAAYLATTDAAQDVFRITAHPHVDFKLKSPPPTCKLVAVAKL